MVWRRNLLAGHARAVRAQSAEQRVPVAGTARHERESSAAGVGVGGALPDWETGRAADAGPRPFYRAAIVSLAVTCALAIIISSSIRPAGWLPGPQRDMIVGSLGGLCLSAVLGTASLTRRGRSWPAAWAGRLAAPGERAALWLAVAAWLPFLLAVVYYRAEATLPLGVRWLNFGYEDKRWISAVYLLGALAPMIWLTAAARVLTVGRGQPPWRWRAWPAAAAFPRGGAAGGRAGPANAAGADGELTAPRRSRAARTAAVAAGLATALGLAWYFLGPPWYLTQNSSPVTPQEDIWLTGFQAITRGHLPYIGVAGVQYGPGTQLTAYLLMRHVTSFSVVGFRQAWAIYQWAGASILFAVFFLAFGYARGFAVSLFSALVYPALHQVAFQPGESFNGYFAWANPLRYAGMIALVALLPPVIRRCPSWRGAAAGAGLGALWGITSYLAQENLIAGAAGAAAAGSLLLLTGTSSWRSVRAALAGALAGFGLVWLPVLAFYVLHGDLGQFLRLYFLFPDAVAQGFSNTAWPGSRLPLAAMFYDLPFLLAAVALVAVLDVRPVRIAAGWSRERTRLAVTVIITILLYQGALLRSDASHLTGTLLMVPALVIVTATVAPRLLGVRRRMTAVIAGTALAGASLALLPRPAFTWTSVRSAAEAPYLDRQRLEAGPPPARTATLAGRRIGAGLAAAPQCCQGPPVPMAKLVALMNRIHAIVGDRTAYVADFPHGYPGLVYFAADLTPAPVLADKYMTVLTAPQLAAYLAYFRASVLPRTQALVTGSPGTPEARLFLRRYARARRILLHDGSKPYYVLLAPGAPARR